MVNKKNMWFLTLFSLILVLSVYYVTMPTELLINTTEAKDVLKSVEEVGENANLVALRVEREEEVLKELDILSGILTNRESSIEEKNDAFDKMKNINNLKMEEEKLEKLIKNDLKLDSIVKIEGDKVIIHVNSKEKSSELANKIMRLIQSKYDTKMYITVKFE